jgi:predicted AAA+ superfamily ATPase
VFKRKVYDKLLSWKQERQGKSTLLVEGARRVGKSTLVEEFARAEYSTHLIIDFAAVPREIKTLFNEQRHDVGALLKYLFAFYNVNPIVRDTLVVFDEVQRFPLARESLKQLVGDGRYDYIETGSLISIKKNVQDILIPSEEEKIELNPFDFEEFLWALQEERLPEIIKESRETLKPIPEALHRKTERLFREYLLVGGMPQAVVRYVETDSFSEADIIKREILNLYRNDIEKYAGKDQGKITAIFDTLSSQLSKQKRKFVMTSLGKNARVRDYSDAFYWLADARMISVCHNSTDPNVGLGQNLERNSFKCYMADTGLLVTQTLADSGTTSNELYKDILFDRLSINEGMFTENLVAQQLKAQSRKLFFYSSYDNNDPAGNMEIDFLITEPYRNARSKQRVSPIEVKSTKRYGTRSLDKFKERFDKRVGTQYVLHPKTLKVEGERIFLPLYMSPFL